MRNYLSNYIITLSKRREEKVSTLLEEARVGKEQLAVVAKRLNESVGNFTPLVLRRDVPQEIIRSDVTAYNLRDIALRVRDLYEVSNLISLLLESHAEVLSSEISSLEKELIAMEKMAANFSFLLSDNQSYDYAFLEPFTDERIRATDLSTIPDRSGVPFQHLELASVRADEGVLTLAPDSATFQGLGLTVEQVKGNSTAFTVATSNLAEVVQVNNKGWKTIIAAANPVVAPIEGVSDAGSQILLEFKLTAPSPASEIKIIPFADVPAELLKITLYASDDDSDAVEIITNKRVLDRPFTQHFTLQPVNRFRLLINQPVYERRFTETNTVEDRYRTAVERINMLNSDRNRASFSHKIANIERTVDESQDLFSRPSTNLRPDRGVMGQWNIGRTVRNNRWRAQGQSTLIASSFTSTSENLASLDRSTGSMTTLGNYSALGVNKSPVSMVFSDVFSQAAHTSQFQYYYTLGLKHVAIGVEVPGGGSFRGVYVSGVLPSQGEVGEIRLKTSEENVVSSNIALDSRIVTTVEHSVTNVSTPDRESDWTPILPVGQTTIRGERLFVDRYGKGYFRIPALAQGGVTVYRNGYRLSTRSVEIIRNQDGSLRGVRLGGEGFGQHVYTCDYEPAGDHTVINFNDRGFAREPRLASAHDESGAGELFLGTGSRNTVQLAHMPYINLNLNETPVVVKLDNGLVAVDITDYMQLEDVNFPDEGYYYIHSGSSLMFNQPIRSPFRVYYQYMQNTVRFRTVLRCNSTEFASPKVDFVHAKAKTRKPIVAG